MKEALLWGKVNQIIALQKKMDAFLLEQKYIVADILIRVRFIESKLNIKEGEYDDFKKTFVAKLEEYRENLKSGKVRPKITGSDVSYVDDSEPGLPGDEGN